MSTRREARERVLQTLYAYELSGGDVRQHIDLILKPHLGHDDALLEFATKLVLRTIDRTDEADKLISKHTQNWELSRIALIDRLILRMAICEFLAFEQIPPKVTINECIEVAKSFSTDNSGPFVNGVLDAVLTELINADRIQKRGRGRIGMPTIDSNST